MKRNIKLPNPYYGYFFAGIGMIYEISNLAYADEFGIGAAIVWIAWIYFLYTVYKIHQALISHFGKSYPIGPWSATLFHLLPLFNIFWIYHWPHTMEEFAWKREKAHLYNYIIIFFLIFAGGILANLFYFSVGYAILWTAMMVILRSLHEFFEESERGKTSF